MRAEAPSPKHALPLIDAAVLNAVPSAAFVTAPDGAIVQFNRRAQDLWGARPDEREGDASFCGGLKFFEPGGALIPPHATPTAVALRTGDPVRQLEVTIERADGSHVAALVEVELLKGPDGQIDGAITGVLDVSSPSSERARAWQNDDRFRAILEAIPAPIYTTDASGTITFFNRAAQQLAGRTPVLGKDKWGVCWRLLHGCGQELRPEEYPMARAIRERRALLGEEVWALRPDGEKLPVLAHPTPIFDADGALLGAVNMVVNISERKRAEAQRDFLVAELTHRIKNTLAIVTSISRQTFGKSQSDDARRSFDARIHALAQTHSRLAEANWNGVPFETVVLDEFAPYTHDDGFNVRVEGPDITVNPKGALALGMAMHELITNAAKYGALTTKEGAVVVTWRIDPVDNKLRIDWTESGGPHVAPPARTGFGLLLLERALVSDLRGTVTFDFAAGGFKCAMAVPLSVCDLFTA